MKHLRFSLYNDTGLHAQVAMRQLGITYRYAIPQSLGDQWWFLDCQNVPETLPAHITPMEGFDPQKAVGYGLSQEMADTLTRPTTPEAPDGK